MEVVSGQGTECKAGVGLVAILWVYVHDLSGTHRDEYVYSTDLTLTATAVIEAYTERWNIETTFEEMRAYLGLETTRGRCAQTVRRAEPFGLYSVVALLHEQLPAEVQADSVCGVGGEDDGDVLRRHDHRKAIGCGRHGFGTGTHAATFAKLPEALRQTLLTPCGAAVSRNHDVARLKLAGKVKLRGNSCGGQDTSAAIEGRTLGIGHTPHRTVG